MHDFHVCVHAACPDMPAGPDVDWHERTVPTWKLPATQPFVGLPSDFESTFAKLSRLPRMFVELDGSFVWTGETGDSRWQLDGQINELRGQLHHVELRGRAPQERFDELLRLLGWPETPIMVQLVHAGLFVRERNFRETVWPG